MDRYTLVVESMDEVLTRNNYVVEAESEDEALANFQQGEAAFINMECIEFIDSGTPSVIEVKPYCVKDEGQLYMVIAGFTNDNERNNLEIVEYNLEKKEALKVKEEYEKREDVDYCKIVQHQVI